MINMRASYRESTAFRCVELREWLRGSLEKLFVLIVRGGVWVAADEMNRRGRIFVRLWWVGLAVVRLMSCIAYIS